MKKIAFFDTKPYDKVWFDKLNTQYEISYFENKLNSKTVKLATGYDAVCAFVNDEIDKDVIDSLYSYGIKVILMRCAGYSNVDFKEAYGKIHVLRVPAYSPNAIAEYAMSLLLTLNRKTHKAYNRTREFNFSLVGLGGFDLYGKTIGVIGTGRIGKSFIRICKGFGMNVLAYDLYPAKDAGYNYVSLDELLEKSDIISLHCPLTKETYHMLDKEEFKKMKKGVFIINTSRGALIDTEALLTSLNKKKVKAAGLDVYEEEANVFYEDFSGKIIKDDVLALLISKPNVIVTSHQAFLTDEALMNIAETTILNMRQFFSNDKLDNEVCYQCDEKDKKEDCKKIKNGRCF